MLSLTKLQENTLARMLEPRTSERREHKNVVAAVRVYCAKSARLGYTPKQIELQVRDLRDMFVLHGGQGSVVESPAAISRLRAAIRNNS